MKDLLSDVFIHNDIPSRAISSDATSDGSVGDGVGVSITGFMKAVCIGSIAAPPDSDATAVLRLQYSTVSSVASDNADSDYSNFSTDAATASMTFATSDLAAGEGIGIIDVDLAAHGLTGGAIRAQFMTQGTSTPAASAWILLTNRNGKTLAQEHTVVAFP
jgi:hypothetical protein